MATSPAAQPGYCPHCGRHILDATLTPGSRLIGTMICERICRHCHAIVPVLVVGEPLPAVEWRAVRVIARA